MVPKTNEQPHIFAMIDENGDKLLGYFKTIEAVERYFEEESISVARILTVTRVVDAEYPPEPELEFVDRKLAEVVSGSI